jgi:hypothetical protein
MYRTDPEEQPSADDADDTGPLPGITWMPADEAGAVGRPSSGPRHSHPNSGRTPMVAVLAAAVALLAIVALLIAVSHRGSADRGVAAGGSSTPTSVGNDARTRAAVPNAPPTPGRRAGTSASAPSGTAPTHAPQPGEAVSVIGRTLKSGVTGSTVTTPGPAVTNPVVRATKQPKHHRRHRCVRRCG